MARQEKFSRPKENPVGLEREGAGPKTPLTPEEKAKQESPDPANDPEVTCLPNDSDLECRPPEPSEPARGTTSGPRRPDFFPETRSPDPKSGPRLDGTNRFRFQDPALAGGFPYYQRNRACFAPASVQPEGTLKENPVVSKAFEDPILSPAPESLTIKQKVSPETTEIAMRSSQTTTENGPSFSPRVRPSRRPPR